MTAATIPVHIGWSSNSKTGHMPVSTTGSISCPPACKHLKLGTCYARFSWLGLHWKKVDSGQRDMGWDSVLRFVSDLPSGQIHRWNQAGDLPGTGNVINSRLFLQLVEANRGKRGFTYTHKPLTPKNLELIEYANRNGFTVNFSVDSLTDVVKTQQRLQLMGYNIPLVLTVPETFESTDEIKVCPAQIRDDITCLKCQWCAMPERKFVVAFRMHGTRKNKWE